MTEFSEKGRETAYVCGSRGCMGKSDPFSASPVISSNMAIARDSPAARGSGRTAMKVTCAIGIGVGVGPLGTSGVGVPPVPPNHEGNLINDN